MARDFLSTYLNDHLAGSGMALELLSILVTSDDQALWKELKEEINVDRGELEGLMRKLDIAPSAVRRATAVMAEKLAELKMHVDDPSKGGALRRLELMEALALGIDGKTALWTTLQIVAESVPDLRGLDYPRLIERARTQRGLVELRRVQAAIEALRL